MFPLLARLVRRLSPLATAPVGRSDAAPSPRWGRLEALMVALLIALGGALLFSVTRPPEPPPPEEEAGPLPGELSVLRIPTEGGQLPGTVLDRFSSDRLRPPDMGYGLFFTPDGRHLVTANLHGFLVWDAATGRRVRHLPEEGERLGRGALHPDGRLLVACRGTRPTGPLPFWDMATGRLVRQLGDGRFSWTAFTPDGRRLIVSNGTSRATGLEAYDLDTGNRLWRVPAMQNLCLMKTSPDGRTVLVGGGDRELRLHGIDDGRLLWRLPGVLAGIPNYIHDHAAAFAPDGRTIAVVHPTLREAGPDGKPVFVGRIGLRDAVTGAEIRVLRVPVENRFPDGGEPNAIVSVLFAPDGHEVLAAGPEPVVRFLDATTGAERRRLALTDNGIRMVFSPDGRTLAVNEPHAVRLFDWASGKELPASAGTGPLRDAWFTADGKSVLGQGGGEVSLWDADTGRPRRRLAVSADRFSLTAPTEGGVAYLCGEATGVRALKLTAWTLRPVPAPADAFRGLRCHAGTHLATQTLLDLSGVRALDPQTGREVCRVTGLVGWPSGHAILDGGRTLLTWDGTRMFRFHDTATGQERRKYQVPGGELEAGRVQDGPVAYYRTYTVAVSPDGETLAIADGTGRRSLLRDLASGEELRPFATSPPRGFGGQAPDLAFSPDGRMVASFGHGERAVLLAEAATGRLRHRIEAPTGVFTVDFRGDSKGLLTALNDGTVLHWDLLGRLSPPVVATLDASWADLASADAERAFGALRRLALSPAAAVPFLLARLSEVPDRSPVRVRRLIAALDDPQYEVRKQAEEALAELDEAVRSELDKALRAGPSAEARRRLEALRTRLGDGRRELSPGRLRHVRAVEVLEWAGTAEARRALDELAKHKADPELARRARESRARLR